MDKFATPTIFLNGEEDDRLHIACQHLETTRTEFIYQAILIALDRHEAKHGGIMKTGGIREIQAKEGINLAQDQIGQDEKAELRKNRKI